MALTYKISVVLLVVLAVVGATAKKQGKTLPVHKSHGQDFLTDDIVFDHEGIVGSVLQDEDGGGYRPLDPSETKYRLSLIAKLMDGDTDGFVDRDELVTWIRMCYRLLDEQAAIEDFYDYDADDDDLVSWKEYFKEVFKHTEEQIKNFRDKKSKADVGIEPGVLQKYETARKRFLEADVDEDNYLDQEEFFAFHNPEKHEHMQNVLLTEKLIEYDKNGDNIVTPEEFNAQALESGDQDLIEAGNEFFAFFDKNKDRVIDKEEMAGLVMDDNRTEAQEEADELIIVADEDGDGKLSEDEIIENVDRFSESKATLTGQLYHHIWHKDEEIVHDEL